MVKLDLNQIKKISAFTHPSQRNGGNIAGVYINSHSQTISDEKKQNIAKKLGFSETTYIDIMSDNHFKFSFFTPTEPISYCGHASLAGFYLLREKGLIRHLSRVYQVLNNQDKREILFDDDLIMCETTLPHFVQKIATTDLLNYLPELDECDILSTAEVWDNSGVRDILIPLNSKKSLRKIISSDNKTKQLISSLSKKYNAVGIHLFTFDTIEESSFVLARNLAPLVGIDEESATGSSTGSVLAFLLKHKPAILNEKQLYTFEQGDFMQTPSRIYAQYQINSQNKTRIFVGGYAKMIEY